MKFNITIFFLIFNFSLFSQSEFTLNSSEDISEFKIGSNVFDLMSKFKMSFGDKGVQQIADQLKKLTSIIAYSSDSLLGSSNIESCLISFKTYFSRKKSYSLIKILVHLLLIYFSLKFWQIWEVLCSKHMSV